MSKINECLEEMMDLKRIASIKFRSVGGGVSVTKGHIVKMETVYGRGMIETNTGLVIGTDQILEVNGRSFQNLC